jgi:2-polyprenyl-3-methyl-5-hydroxy-6-metoxy-1,4-benzoquinol methylase
MKNMKNMKNKTDYKIINENYYNDKYKILYENYLKNKNALKNSNVGMNYFKMIRITKDILKKEITDKSTKVLEIGCGQGEWAIEMAKMGANVTATDISEMNVKITKLRAERNDISLNTHTCSCDDTGFKSNSFDLIFGFGVIHHLTHNVEESTYKEAYRLLKPGGKIIFIETLNNSKVLNFIRLLIPISQKHNPRPSILSKSYKEFQKNDPHPERENTTKRYELVLNKSGFKNKELKHLGIFSRLDRMTTNYKLRKLVHDVDYFIQPFIPFNKLLSRNIIVSATK